MLSNIFKPLFEVLESPHSYPFLSQILPRVTGISTGPPRHLQLPVSVSNSVIPSDWNFENNPTEEYYLYYLWANLKSLNAFRMKKNYRIFNPNTPIEIPRKKNHGKNSLLFSEPEISSERNLP